MKEAIIAFRLQMRKVRQKQKKKMKHLHNVTQVEYFKTRIQIWELKI